MGVTTQSTLGDLLWVFGYGSLIWKPPEGFQHVKALPGGIKGWHRRLWQGSTDHRGLPGAPGLVATLLQTQDLPEAERPPEDELCWGMCYGYDESQRDQVLQYLDYREKDGYDRATVDVFMPPEGGGATSTVPTIRNVLLYVATTSNPQYLGPLSNQEVAERVATAVGPSGTNHEYVTNLANGLKQIEMAIAAADVSWQAADAHVQSVVEQMGGLQLAAEGSRATAFVGDGQHRGDGGWMLQKLWELTDFAWKELEGGPGLYAAGGGGQGGETRVFLEALSRIGWPPSMAPSPAAVCLPSEQGSGQGGGRGEATVAKFPCGGGLVRLHGEGGGLVLCTQSALTRALAGPTSA